MANAARSAVAVQTRRLNAPPLSGTDFLNFPEQDPLLTDIQTRVNELKQQVGFFNLNLNIILSNFQPSDFKRQFDYAKQRNYVLNLKIVGKYGVILFVLKLNFLSFWN